MEARRVESKMNESASSSKHHRIRKVRRRCASTYYYLEAFLCLLIVATAECSSSASDSLGGISCTHLQRRRKPHQLLDEHSLKHSFRSRGRSVTVPLKSSCRIFRYRGGGQKTNREVAIIEQDELIKQKETLENKRLMILIKVLFLSYYGSLGCLMPYLPVYYHSLGHGGLIIGMIGAVKPLTTFIVAPFWGFLADRSGDKFRILKLTFLVSLIGQLSVSYSHEVNFMVGMTLFSAIMNAPVKCLIDSMVMDNLNEEDRSQYGRLRLWGQLGFGLGSSGVGMLLSRSQALFSDNADTAPSMAPLVEGAAYVQNGMRQLHNFGIHFWHNLTGYKLLFASYAALSIPTWLCLQKFHKMETEKRQIAATQSPKGKKVIVEEEKRGANVLQGLNMLIHNSDAILFFFLVFVVGISSGCIENFAYVRIREVGGSGKEMGLSRLVSSAAGAPMFWFSGPLTERLGADRVLVLSLLSYVLRFFIYALMRNPYHGLPAEALRGVAFAAFWSTCTVYAHRISPPGMSATMLMFMNAMYGGLGQSLGAIIGGKLQTTYGTVKTFVYSGIFDLCFVGLVVAYLSVRQGSSFRDPKPIVPFDSELKKSRV
uniref:Major facilitator superfamily (MFS) profile domain-containing protein n=1 Tax=Attheya septentrionalis TaxID=420275 RepID=A0A7S2XSE9_9STRA|mmetsp:Transcript_523/g.893  ORF Transcript_523/g.893 Transcript_523/m.893 type:complete len:598 (+) Transcript_523:234-2027(+)